MFTPGPWRIGENASVITDQQVGLELPGPETVFHYGGGLICETITPANARLVAAAPEMYDLLLRIKQTGFVSLRDAVLAEIEQVLRKVDCGA